MGSNFIFPSNILSPSAFCDYKYAKAKQTGIDINSFKKLFYRYGSNLDIINEKAFELHGIAPWQQIWFQAKMEYVITREMCVTLSDFLIQRTESIFFDPEFVRYNLLIIPGIFIQFPGWKDIEKELQMAEF